MSQLRSISRLTFINGCSAVVSLGTSVAMAWLFGTSAPAQVYLAASTLLIIVQKVFMVGQFSDVFLPQYVAIRETDGAVKADRCFSALINHMVIMVLGAGVVLIWAAPTLAGLMAEGFTAAQQHQVGRLLQGLVPALLLVVMNGHLQIVGNARGWYGRFEFYGLLGNFIGLVGFVATAKTLGIWSMVLAQWLTQIIALAGSLNYLRRNGYRHSWITHEPGFSAWGVTGRVGLTAVYVLATQLYSFAFTSAMTFLPGGGFSAYKYAENLYSRIGSLFMRPVSVVFLTDASVLARRDPEQMRARIAQALYHYGLMYLGVIGVLFPAMRNLLGGLWGSKLYPASDIHLTTIYILCLFGLLIVDGTGLIYRRLNIVMGDLRWQYYGLTLVQMCFVFLAPAIIGKLGVDGAPVVLGLNIICCFLVAIVLIFWRRPQYFAFFPTNTWKLVVTAIGPLLVAWLLPHLWPWLKYSGNFTPMGKVMELGKGVLMASLGLGLVAGMAALLKVDEAAATWRWLRNQWSVIRRGRVL